MPYVVGILGLLLLASGWGNVHLIGEVARSEQALESTVIALADYATRTEQEVEAYRISTEILSREFQAERNIRDDKFKSIKDRDLDRMAKHKPKALSRILTGRTHGLLEDLADASAGTRDRGDASTAKTGTNGTTDD